MAVDFDNYRSSYPSLKYHHDFLNNLIFVSNLFKKKKKKRKKQQGLSAMSAKFNENKSDVTSTDKFV